MLFTSRLLAAAIIAVIPTFALTITVPLHEKRSTVANCPGFIGNPDLYGLGIRLGVYSQWFSSWLTNTFNPTAASGNHNANSIFLLALLIAITVAVASDDIKPVEAYMMLHICFGFVLTVMSLLGVRIYFLNPTTLTDFLQSLSQQSSKLKKSIARRTADLKEAFQHLENWLETRHARRRRKQSATLEHDQQRSRRLSTASNPALGQHTIFRTLVRNLRHMGDASLASSKWVQALTVNFTSSAVSFLKHPSLSWSGVAWRSAILSYLIGLNLWLWWSPWLAAKTTATNNNSSNPPSHHCPAPIYFFGLRPDGLHSPTLLTFFRALSLLLAIPALWLCWVILSAALAMWKFVLGFVARALVVRTFEALRPGAWDALHDGVKFGIGLLLTPVLLWDNIWPYAVIDVFLGMPVMLRGIYTFWTVGAAELPGSSELAMPFVSFMSRGVDLGRVLVRPRGLEGEEGEGGRVRVSRTAVVLCGLFHAFNLATMTCFIVFIEKSIIVAEISGVYSLRSTGQLIPFIIGLGSFTASIREIVLLHLRRKYPDWHTRSLTFNFGPGPSVCDLHEKKETNVKVVSAVCTPQPGSENPMEGLGRTR